MARRSATSAWTRALQRSLRTLTRTTLKAGTKAVKQALASNTKAVKRAGKTASKTASKTAGQTAAKPAAKPARQMAGKTTLSAAPRLARGGSAPALDVGGLSLGLAGARRYRLYTPPGLQRGERLPLLVMLHGCGQTAASFALSTRMNRLAAREHCFVLYPEQDRLAHPQACWNWYDTRTGRAQAEAALIVAAIDQVCLLQPVDTARIAVAGLSAGASMAALLAVRYPARFRAVAMHSGVAPGAAHSTATALRAMSGLAHAPTPLSLPAAATGVTSLPPLLVIHGSADRVVAASNARAAAQRWADALGARAAAPRTVQRGERHPVTVTDFKHQGRLAVSLCLVQGLGHAWSGGAAGQPYGDAQGPDASRMIWAFVARQFGPARRGAAAPLAA